MHDFHNTNYLIYKYTVSVSKIRRSTLKDQNNPLIGSKTKMENVSREK